MHRRESGTLLLRKPGLMRWTYSNPAGKLFVLDGKDGWFYSPGATEVQRVPAKKLDDLRSPLRFLLGHAQVAKELSGLTVSPSPGLTGSDDFTLAGVPRGMEQRIASFKLTVALDGTIHAMRIEETDGAVTSFTFTSEQADPPTSKADFLFQPPPGVNIVSGPPPI